MIVMLWQTPASEKFNSFLLLLWAARLTSGRETAGGENVRSFRPWNAHVCIRIGRSRNATTYHYCVFGSMDRSLPTCASGATQRVFQPEPWPNFAVDGWYVIACAMVMFNPAILVSRDCFVKGEYRRIPFEKDSPYSPVLLPLPSSTVTPTIIEREFDDFLCVCQVQRSRTIEQARLRFPDRSRINEVMRGLSVFTIRQSYMKGMFVSRCR